jgi:hypothetical protein
MPRTNLATTRGDDPEGNREPPTPPSHSTTTTRSCSSAWTFDGFVFPTRRLVHLHDANGVAPDHTPGKYAHQIRQMFATAVP